eukprot:CAMPEP_0201727018 /NCGR_PEP_ID=MMETSP0593-20130828/10584_1 /ASSEMBLY_ACC=CAM_ASM_000672 /TAXON_ID=267983 /ORGANISM="Skeletonema japonicum, Strain CCMP2506" /LENGTH=215 /DNA_ID=CAMNT_0048218627 /DNA_START=81 /DNA_END=728 /DNA_ORIENTATION=-
MSTCNRVLSIPAILLVVLAAICNQSAYGFSPSIIRSSTCKTTNTNTANAKNFHVGVTAVTSSSTLFSSEESLENVESDDGNPDPASSIPQQPVTTSKKKLDPLIASLTRIDEPTPSNVPMRSVPLFGEVPADGNLALLVPAAGIAILGFIFSIVVAFNARDELVSELNRVELPKMEYKPTVVVEGQCRGLCSNQDDDVDGLRNFMESISRKESVY